MKFLKILTGFLAFILCIIIFVLQIGTHIVFNASGLTTPEGIKSVVYDINTDEILLEKDGEESKIYKNLTDSGIKAGLSEEDIEGIINSKVLSSTLKEIVSLYLIDITGSIINENNTKNLTSTKLTEIAETNIDSIINEVNGSSNPELRNEIMDYIETEADNIIESFPDASELTKNASEKDIAVFKFCLSNEMKMLLIGTILILVSIIALIRFTLYGWLIWNGVTTLIASNFVLAIGLFGEKVLTLLKVEDIVLVLLKPIIGLFTVSGLIGLSIGILQIVLYFIFKHLKKNKSEKIVKEDMATLS